MARYAPGEFLNHFGRTGGEGHHAGELIAAEPRQQPAGREQFGDPPRAGLEQGIADAVPVGVVDPLEVVDVDHHETDVFVAIDALGDQRVGGAGDCPAVEAAGQWIVLGQFAGPRLCLTADTDFFRQVTIAAQAEHDQGDVEQQGIGQQAIGRQANPLQRANHGRHDICAGADEHDDRRHADGEDHQIAVRPAGARIRVAVGGICPGRFTHVSHGRSSAIDQRTMPELS